MKQLFKNIAKWLLQHTIYADIYSEIACLKRTADTWLDHYLHGSDNVHPFLITYREKVDFGISPFTHRECDLLANLGISSEKLCQHFFKSKKYRKLTTDQKIALCRIAYIEVISSENENFDGKNADNRTNARLASALNMF